MNFPWTWLACLCILSKNEYKLLVLEFETNCLMLNCTSTHKGLFVYVSLAKII